MNDHRCMRDIPASDVVEIVQRVLGEAGARAHQRFVSLRVSGAISTKIANPAEP